MTNHLKSSLSNTKKVISERIAREWFAEDEATLKWLAETDHAVSPETSDWLKTQTAKLAAIIARHLASEWQPIETAPKDGTRCLLWWPYWRQHPVSGWFSKAVNAWDSEEFPLFEGGIGPTHWMPLPAPPNAAQAETRPRQIFDAGFAAQPSAGEAQPPTIFCEQCGKHVPLLPIPTGTDDLNPKPWGDIVCPECRFVVASITTPREGIYALTASTPAIAPAEDAVKVCNGCLNDWPLANGIHKWRNITIPCEKFIWPEHITVVRYEDGGFSATTAEPPPNAQFAKVYRATTTPAASDAEYWQRRSHEPRVNLDTKDWCLCGLPVTHKVHTLATSEEPLDAEAQREKALSVAARIFAEVFDSRSEFQMPNIHVRGMLANEIVDILLSEYARAQGADAVWDEAIRIAKAVSTVRGVEDFAEAREPWDVQSEIVRALEAARDAHKAEGGENG